MDIIFTLLAVILVALLITFRWLNIIDKTDDLTHLFSTITKSEGFISSFCLGRSKVTKKYINVQVGEDGKLNSYESNNPINHAGVEFEVDLPHGDVIKQENGFSIEGIDQTFICPEGYEGSDCHMTSICNSSDDNGLVKRLTKTQFRSLGLYEMSISQVNYNNNNGNDDELLHPKVRVKCLQGGKYEIEACPADLELNDEAKCVASDLCETRANGFRWKNDDTSYYICHNGIKQLKRCDDNHVFDENSLACVVKSRCHEARTATIDLDENRFVRCDTNMGTIVECAHGVEFTNGLHSCRGKPCIESYISYHDDVLRYNFGRITCKGTEQEVKVCDHNFTRKSWDWRWGDAFSFSINNYPTCILNGENECTTQFDDVMVINNPTTMMLRWSAAMPKEHEFDLYNQKYLCKSTDDKYIIDYKNMTILSANSLATNEILNTAQPCHKETIKLTLFPIKMFPSNIYILYTINTMLDFYDGRSLWPSVVENDSVISYQCTECKYDYTRQKMIVITVTSNQIPIGFKKTGGNELQLDGYLEYSNKEKESQQHYFIATGKPESARFFADDEYYAVIDENLDQLQMLKVEQEYDMKAKVDTDKESDWFAIDWTKIKKRQLHVIPNVIFNRDDYGFFTIYNDELGSNPFHAGFILFKVDNVTKDSCTLHMGNSNSWIVRRDQYKVLDFVQEED